MQNFYSVNYSVKVYNACEKEIKLKQPIIIFVITLEKAYTYVCYTQHTST